MGSAWVDHPSWELVAEASAACDRDVDHLLLHADAEELKATRNSQLATFVLSMVVLDAVERTGLAPNVAAGHSLGEYSALAGVGAIAYDDGVRLVAERGEAMQVAGEEREGTMAAVLGMDDDMVEAACARVGHDVWVANYNAPGQVVIAGSPDGVEAAGRQAKEAGAKRVMSLQVGGAFHTPYMAPARDRLRKALSEAEFRDLSVPVVANVDAQPHDAAGEWPDLLAAQLCSPVRWRQTLYRLADEGATTLVELGPGAVLTGMAKRTLGGSRTISVCAPADVDLLLESLTDDRHHTPASGQGESLHVTERVVVSPAAGLFRPAEGLETGTPVAVGQVIGAVGEHDVVSPFAGSLMGVIALEGQRVMPRQPIAWLRTNEETMQ
jgi:[acyl-carrier-protein] S-malonyltransferase